MNHDQNFLVLCDPTQDKTRNKLVILYQGEVAGHISRSKWIKWLDDTAVNMYQVSGFWALRPEVQPYCINDAASLYLYREAMP